MNRWYKIFGKMCSYCSQLTSLDENDWIWIISLIWTIEMHFGVDGIYFHKRETSFLLLKRKYVVKSFSIHTFFLYKMMFHVYENIFYHLFKKEILKKDNMYVNIR